MAVIGALAKVAKLTTKAPPPSLGTLDVSTLKAADEAVEMVEQAPIKQDIGALSLDDLKESEIIDTSPIDYVPDAGKHTEADQPFVDYLKDDVGFDAVDPQVSGNSLRVYTEALDQLYKFLPLAKGTPRSVLSLRGRLSVRPLTKEAVGAPVKVMTRGMFGNTSMGDNPTIFLRRTGPEGTSDYFEKIRTVQHEWFHALDDYMLTHFSDSYKYDLKSGQVSALRSREDIIEQSRMASSDAAKLSGMRPELFEVWDRLRLAIITPDVRGGRPNMAARIEDDSGDYVNRNWEMMSRAFEQYMEVKEATSVGEPAMLSRGVSYPYADEMKVLEPLFDDLFAGLKVRKAKTRFKKEIPTWYGAAPVIGVGVAGQKEGATEVAPPL